MSDGEKSPQIEDNMDNKEIKELINRTCDKAVYISNSVASVKGQPQHEKDLVAGAITIYRDMILSQLKDWKRNKAQIKIQGIVQDYKTIFQDEYKAFCKQQHQVREGNLNEFASVKGDMAIERKLFDTPATLHSMLVEKLDGEELKWFKTKKGGRWFAKYFIEFRASKKIWK